MIAEIFKVFILASSGIGVALCVGLVIAGAFFGMGFLIEKTMNLIRCIVFCRWLLQKDFSEIYDQGTWRCGTTYCLAGHIAEADGWKWAYPQEEQSALMIKDEVRVSADTAAERSVFPEDDYSDSVVSIFFAMFLLIIL